MSTIIRNTASGGAAQIYRYNGSILRTPLTIRVLPDQKKICQIGEPRSADNMGYLRAGFQVNYTYAATVESVGYRLVNEIVNGTPQWLDASGNHDPEFVWFQGAYATGAQTIANGKFMSEAYASFPGFHFTLPQAAIGHVKNVIVHFLNMGCTFAYGPAIDGNANNKNIKSADYSFEGDVFLPFHVLNSATCNYHPMDINNNSPYDSVEVSQYGSVGDFRGYRDIFTNAPLGVVDGCIPTLTNPVRQSYTMSASTRSHFIQNGAGWIVPTVHPVITSTSNYGPCSGYGGDGTNNYWACVSLRDIYIDVQLDIGED